MKHREFIIELKKNLRTEVVIHREVITVPAEHCVRNRGAYSPLILIKTNYIANALLPYFDMLHDYSVIGVYVADGTSKKFEIQLHRDKLAKWFS